MLFSIRQFKLASGLHPLKAKMDVRFPHGSTHLVVGPSGAGKTSRVVDYLQMKDDLIVGGKDIKNVVFCYAVWQPLFDKLRDEKVVTKWVNQCPTNEQFLELVNDYKKDGGSIVVIDDFMGQISKDLVEIVTVSSRHTNTSTFLLFQSLFPANPLARQISLNIKVMHLHKNPRENFQLSVLARQLRPGNYKWILEAYHEATKMPFSCFIIDLLQSTPENMRFRSNLLPSEFPICVWGEKGSLSPMKLV